MALSREELLRRTARRFIQVSLPDGASVWLQSLSDDERGAYETSFKYNKQGHPVDLDCAKRRLLVRCLVDKDGGTRFYSDAEEDLLKPLDGRDTGILYDACRKHCGFESGEIEALVKNCEPAPV